MEGRWFTLELDAVVKISKLAVGADI